MIIDPAKHRRPVEVIRIRMVDRRVADGTFGCPADAEEPPLAGGPARSSLFAETYVVRLGIERQITTPSEIRKGTRSYPTGFGTEEPKLTTLLPCP
jgi:hypothetical protein